MWECMIVCGILTMLMCAPSPAQESASITPERLTHDGHFKERPDWSPDGVKLLFTMHRGSNIAQYIWTRDTAKAQKVSTRQDPEFDGVWSPDGKSIAFTFDKASPNQGNQEVYVCDVDGQQLRAVAVDSGTLSHEEWPSWSPDGVSLVYVSTRHGNPELYVCKAAGGDERRLTSDPALDAHPAWSPDGKSIAFATNRWGDWELALLDVTTLGVRRLTSSRNLDDYPAWSKDGKRLAFTSNRGGNLDIYTLDLGTQQVINVSNHAAIDNFPTWTPDGGLTWVSNRNQGFDLYRLSASQLARR